MTYYKALKAHAWIGESLPTELLPYASKPYSYQRWVEDDLNGEAGPGAGGPPVTPTAAQVEDARVITVAAAAKFRSVLVANSPGTGKTFVALLAAKEIARMRGSRTILITVDRPARITIPTWRAAIAALGDDGLRWVIMSSDGLGKLMSRNGRPSHAFDLVIADEAHLFRHDTKRTAYMRRLCRATAPADKAPFVLWMTATPGHHPGEWGYLGSLFAQLHGDDPADWADFGQALASRGHPLVRSFGKWVLSPEAKESPEIEERFIAQVRDELLHHDPPLMLARQAHWGRPPLDMQLVELTADQRRGYELEWGAFRREMQLARSGRDSARGLAAILRLRQKASLLRVEHTVDAVRAELDKGFQVLVATELVTTGAQPLVEQLEAAGIPVARIYGSNPDAEAERLRFQRGQAQVVVFNTPSSINLQAGELLADGSTATMTPRRGFFHQARWSGLMAEQIMGRAHRNGMVCQWSLLAAEDTIEQRTAEIMVRRLIATAASTNSDTSALTDIVELFTGEWMPTAALNKLLT
ncbi:DEAD/DEAH box helicase [Dietzia sp. ANT_WB102]|uniref:DEAD/DEAH box helicase n=1 Tax=Dietzia sp. ANT_WB102 TaxID=2597345 RepID=UPI002102467B|nr:DEAD/DEAH box helicase [Dietzia sp. ANT_WB102]